MNRSGAAVFLVCCLLLSSGSGAHAQVDCNAIMNQILNSGPGQLGPDGAQALANQYNSNCLGQPQPSTNYQQPSYTPPPSPPPNLLDNAIMRESERLGALIMKGAPLITGPLSQSFVVQQNMIVPPPQGYVDPFASRGTPVLSSEPPGTVHNGNIWDPGQASYLQPPKQAPELPAAPPAPIYVPPSGNTFGAPE